MLVTLWWWHIYNDGNIIIIIIIGDFLNVFIDNRLPTSQFEILKLVTKTFTVAHIRGCILDAASTNIRPTVIHSVAHDMMQIIKKFAIDVFLGTKFELRIYVRDSDSPSLSNSEILLDTLNGFFTKGFVRFMMKLSSQFILPYMVTFKINCFLLCCFVLHETMTSLCKIITFW